MAGGVNTTSFTLTGTLSQINSRLANLTVNLPTNAGVTAADWNGTFNVTVVVNDNANHGSRPTTLTGDSNNPNANPATSATPMTPPPRWSPPVPLA